MHPCASPSRILGHVMRSANGEWTKLASLYDRGSLGSGSQTPDARPFAGPVVRNPVGAPRYGEALADRSTWPVRYSSITASPWW